MEFPRETPLKSRVQLEQRRVEDASNIIQQVVHNHFAHRAELAELEFRNLMRHGRTSLIIGLSCLASCLAIQSDVTAGEGDCSPYTGEYLQPRLKSSHGQKQKQC